jgi:hypothetical protein
MNYGNEVSSPIHELGRNRNLHYTIITILDTVQGDKFYLKKNVLETGLCLVFRCYLLSRAQSTMQIPPEGGDRMQCLKRNVLNKRRDDGEYSELQQLY